MVMTVGHELQVEARRHGIALSPASSATWLTRRGHLNPYVRAHAPADTLDALDEVHAALGGSRRALARAVDTPLTPSWQVRTGGQHVEIDDVGHFTSDRLTTLGLYPVTASFGFSLDTYRALIETWRERAAAMFTRRWSADFDFAGGRRARRAYEDALRDLLTPVFTGLPLLRLATPDGDVRSAVHQLGLRLATVS